MVRTTILLLLAAGWRCQEVSSFSLLQQQQRVNCAQYQCSSTIILAMGLYDTPLPPRPPPRDDDKDDGDSVEDKDRDNVDATSKELPVSARQSAPQRLLFEFNAKGAEVQELLPPVGRRLDSGSGCYYNTEDRTVVTLAEQTTCAPEDAAWALEACKGDRTEARTRIAVAQRKRLELDAMASMATKPSSPDNTETKNVTPDYLQQVKADLQSLMVEEEFQERKAERLREAEIKKESDRFFPEKADTPYLPIENPKPIDDEPWFTG